jgi:nucleoid DNA-binding protein
VERKQVEAVFGSLAGLIRGHMQKRGSGEFTVPEIGVKIVRARKPATKARKGRNPATGEEITIPAKPAHDVVRLSALKVLKDTVA